MYYVIYKKHMSLVKNLIQKVEASWKEGKRDGGRKEGGKKDGGKNGTKEGKNGKRKGERQRNRVERKEEGREGGRIRNLTSSFSTQSSSPEALITKGSKRCSKILLMVLHSTERQTMDSAPVPIGFPLPKEKKDRRARIFQESEFALACNNDYVAEKKTQATRSQHSHIQTSQVVVLKVAHFHHWKAGALRTLRTVYPSSPKIMC